MSSPFFGPILKTALFVSPGPRNRARLDSLPAARESHPLAVGVVQLAGARAAGIRSCNTFEVRVGVCCGGTGTPAPIDPPRNLVVSGLYRFVRNPMYVGVALVLLSEAALFGSFRLLEYALIVWAAFFLFVVAYEEPALRRKFGVSYQAYFEAVPRWIPRLTPWSPGK